MSFLIASKIKVKVNMGLRGDTIVIEVSFSDPIIHKVVVRGISQGDLILSQDYINHIKPLVDIAIEKGTEVGNSIIKSVEEMVNGDYNRVNKLLDSDVYWVMREIAQRIAGWIEYEKETVMDETIMYAHIRKYLIVKYDNFVETRVEVYTRRSEIARSCVECHKDKNEWERCVMTDKLCDIEVKYTNTPVSYILRSIRDEMKMKKNSS